MLNKIKSMIFSGKWLIILTVLIASIFIYSKYDQIEERSIKDQVTQFNRQYLPDLGQIRWALLYELLQENYSDDEIFEQLVTLNGQTIFQWDFENWGNNPSEKDFADLNREELQELTSLFVRERFDEMVMDFQIQQHHYRDLQFAVFNHQSEQILYQGGPILQKAARQVVVDEALEAELRTDFLHVISFHLDERGNMSIPLGFDSRIPQGTFEMIGGTGFISLTTPQRSFINFLDASPSQQIFSDIMRGEFNYFRLTPPTNITFTFAIPIYDNNLIWNNTSSMSWFFRNITLEYGALTGVGVALISLLIPVKKARQWSLMKWLLKFPIEIMPIFILGMYILVFHFIPEVVEQTILHSTLNLTGLDILYYHVLNIGLWSGFFMIIVYGILYIKNLFKQGVKKSLRYNSILTGNLLKLHDFLTIDLKNSGIKNIFLLVFFQGFLISLITLPLGAISPGLYLLTLMAIGGYSMVLFLILKKKLTSIQKNYLRLFEITNEMSNGNLEVKIEENLGVFESIKEQLSQIKNGFKKAVENETISQRMKTDLIANVSHDLKTPLTSIITYVDLLKDEGLEPEKRELYLTTLEQKSNRLKVLIEDLFEMSKVTSGDIKLDIQEIDVVSLMKQTLSELDDKINEIQLTIRSNFPEQKVKLNLDGARTYRIFENLIFNMAKYALPNTRAYIDIMESEQDVTIMLRNISATEISIEINELTERFVRGDQSRHTEGSGLGLAIAKNLVEIQKGTFNVQVDGDLFKVVMVFKKSAS